MKKAILLLVCIAGTISCFSQSLFFDSYTKATWIATVYSKDASLTNAKKIGLSKLEVSKDSLKSNETCWNFNNGLLTITHYDHQLKTETPVATYHYQMNADKGTISIALPDTLQPFDVGINSSGKFALLMKKKQGKKKP
jgi:hypothetical protein